MTERPKVHDWKSCVPPKGTVGSNPTLSAIYLKRRLKIASFFCVFVKFVETLGLVPFFEDEEDC